MHKIIINKLLCNLSIGIMAVFMISLSGCNKTTEKGDAAYIASINQWHQARIERLKKENGWLNLAGLYWLSEGENSFGSDPSNKIIFPKDKAPAFIGSIILKDGKASIKINKGINVTSENKPVSETELVSDSADNATVLALGTLRWVYIRRSGKFGIRLRDFEASLVKNFKGIDTYPVNSDWRFNAKFTPYNPPRVIPVSTIIGTVEQDTVPGIISFNVNGKEYKLEPVKEGNDFFIIFADKTNGSETYGAGRFLYASQPDSAGNVILDFNKAYNPPCAFTKFATCPLPPEQNYLQLEITAGEKVYGEGHH
ncbi:MAG: DUF1684 domain-containing protein [Ignavibacteriaceae bacterium]|nr:DUF1684 domain-containing protein [Ignavibacteriaceae bacterium]